MPKAHLITRSGTKITIEGTEDEVASLVLRLDNRRDEKAEGPITEEKRRSASTRGKVKATPLSLVKHLIDENFFEKPRALGEIKTALQEQGRFYPTTTLSPIVLRLVRQKELRRVKEKNRWLYVN